MDDSLFTLSQDQQMQLLHSVLLLVFITSGLFAHFRGQPGTAIKQAGLWIIIICALVILYSFRYEFYDLRDRLVGELTPARPLQNQDGSLSFRISADGHYHIKTQINGRDVIFMLDTGASDVVLTQETAKHIGINPNNLNYTKIYHTANGTVKGAPITLRRIKIGNYIINDVRASVNGSQMNSSLLGMSFLDKLQAYEVRNGILTIWP